MYLPPMCLFKLVAEYWQDSKIYANFLAAIRSDKLGVGSGNYLAGYRYTFSLSLGKRISMKINNTFFFVCLGLFWVSAASAQEGTKQLESPHSVASTIDRLTAVLESKGMNIFARVDHAANAESVDMNLRPTELLIFGNPRIGTPLMNCSQSIAIDLPQKMLAWQDESGQTYLTWNDPLYLESRHDLQGCDEVLEKVSVALANFAQAATADQ
jgi:uncharacterized protein (DUF302 family)